MTKKINPVRESVRGIRHHVHDKNQNSKRVPASFSNGVKFLKIKPFQETLYKSYCAPATLKMLLDYYGVEKSEKELAHLMGTTKEAGTTVEDFVKALKKFGLKAKVKDYATFKDIDGYLKKGIPVVVDWFTKGRSDDPEHFTADGHYSIVVGLDKTYIYLEDPEIGRMRKLKREDFLKVWFDYLGDYLKSPKQMVIREMIAVYPVRSRIPCGLPRG